MFYALSSSGIKINADTACKGNKFKCLCCNEEVILAKGLVNKPYFRHKSLHDCDSWYAHSEWLGNIQGMYSIDYCDIIVKSKEHRHRCNVVTGGFYITICNKNIGNKDFVERVKFYSSFKDKRIIFLFNVSDKDINFYSMKEYGTYSFHWRHAYKFGNFDIEDLSYKFNTDIYLYKNKYVYKILSKDNTSPISGVVRRYSLDNFIKYTSTESPNLYDIYNLDLNYFTDKFSNFFKLNLNYKTMVYNLNYFMGWYINQLSMEERSYHKYIDTTINAGEIRRMFEQLFNSYKRNLFSKAKNMKLTITLKNRILYYYYILYNVCSLNLEGITQYDGLIIYKQVFDEYNKTKNHKKYANYYRR